MERDCKKKHQHTWHANCSTYWCSLINELSLIRQYLSNEHGNAISSPGFVFLSLCWGSIKGSTNKYASTQPGNGSRAAETTPEGRMMAKGICFWISRLGGKSGTLEVGSLTAPVYRKPKRKKSSSTNITHRQIQDCFEVIHTCLAKYTTNTFFLLEHQQKHRQKTAGSMHKHLCNSLGKGISIPPATRTSSWNTPLGHLCVNPLSSHLLKQRISTAGQI